MIGTKLTFEKIENSRQITNWLKQFDPADILIAKTLLCRLMFISVNEYTNWLLEKLSHYSTLQRPAAIYSVRKFDPPVNSLWQEDGLTQPRPASTQGSEDLVSSIISKSIRLHGRSFLDHPNLDTLRTEKVRDIILVDDSIGSGKRVAEFIKLMTNNKSFMSWWNGGYIRLHILSYARTRQSEQYIKMQTPGSDLKVMKVPISDKVLFDSNIVYDKYYLNTRWGDYAENIENLCDSTTKIRQNMRRGFGRVMSNIVFFHSVPNNIPGMLFYNGNRWNPLFPGRALPNWAIDLLSRKETPTKVETTSGFDTLCLSDYMVDLLKAIKKGVRTQAGLSRRLDLDIQIIINLLEQATRLGLITDDKRILNGGRDYLFKSNINKKLDYDYSLYQPQSWCSGYGDLPAV